MAITSANKDGNNICHRMIQYSHEWQNNSHSGNNICHQPNNIQTMAITSAKKNMAIKSANKYITMGITAATKRMAITSAICKTTIGQHQPIYRHITCLVVKHLPVKPTQCPKNCRTHQHSDTFSVGYNKE